MVLVSSFGELWRLRVPVFLLCARFFRNDLFFVIRPFFHNALAHYNISVAHHKNLWCITKTGTRNLQTGPRNPKQEPLVIPASVSLTCIYVVHYDMINEQQCYLWALQQIFRSTALFEGFTHGSITTAIYFLQLIGCMEFSVIVAIAICEHLHEIP